jgi:predicted phosphodiesterase
MGRFGMNNKIKELFLEDDQRLFICGDLHGTISLLESSLASLGFKEGYDVLLCVGDLVDRGEESEKTLRKFLFDKTGSYFSVRGNHEDFMVIMIGNYSSIMVVSGFLVLIMTLELYMEN